MLNTRLQIKTTGIDHIVLWVSDLERSKEFYVDILGMSVAHESNWQVFLHCGQSDQIALFDSTARGLTQIQGVELNHIALRMEPASHEQTKQRLTDEGIVVEGRTGDPSCIYFDDPDGHRLQLLYRGHE